MNPFIKTSIEKIKYALENNKLTLFVGAGVSMNSGLPSWKELVDTFAVELGIPNKKYYSADEYLKIPQFYFNERQEKEYYDQIIKVFNKSQYKPNIIHKKLFDLNPQHVITTNFDNLLELAVSENRYNFYTVKSDKELSYCSSNRIIIKMHGDLKLKNIVLKEDDYLSYSNNFPLIENYIKSLFCTNLILFVGYSAEDPDFKLIFKWVKDQLGSSFQPAYLVETKKDFNNIEFNYYKNRGINILYLNEIKKELKEYDYENSRLIDNEQGKNLLAFINCITDGNNIDLLNEDELIDVLFDCLLPFNKLRALLYEDIVKILGKINMKTYFDINNSELIINDDNLYKFFEDVFTVKRDTEKVKMIVAILNNSGIYNIRIGDKEISLIDASSKENNDNKLYDNTFEFDFINLDREIENASPKNEQDYLKLAFYQYEKDNYLRAYELLKEASNLSFCNGNYLCYFISESNKKQLSSIIFNRLNDDIRIQEIKKEIERIDLQEEYTKLPLKDRKIVYSFMDIMNFNYIYKYNFKLQKLVDDIYKEKRLVEDGGFSFNNNLNNLYKQIKSMWQYINFNYLMVDHFKETKNLYYSFIKGILINMSINYDAEKNDEAFFKGTTNNKIEELKDEFIVFLMIGGINDDDLKNLIIEYKIKKIKVNDDCKNYIIRSFNSCTEYICTEKVDIYLNPKYHKYINNCLTLLELIELNKDEFNKTMDNILKLQNQKLLYNNYKYISNFIYGIYNKNKSIMDIDKLTQFLKVYINKILRDNITFYDINANERMNIFKNMTYIIHDLDNKYRWNEEFQIKNLIFIVNNDLETYDENVMVIVNCVLIPIYKLVSIDIKDSIREVIDKVLNIIYVNKNNKAYLELFYQACSNEILKPEENQKEQFINCIKEIININKNKGIQPSPIENSLMRLIDLIRINEIDFSKYNKEIEKFSIYSDFFCFLINIDSYDCNKLKLQWLKYLSPKEMNILLMEEERKNKIKELLKNKILEDNCDKRYKEILIQYFM